MAVEGAGNLVESFQVIIVNLAGDLVDQLCRELIHFVVVEEAMLLNWTSRVDSDVAVDISPPVSMAVGRLQFVKGRAQFRDDGEVVQGKGKTRPVSN